MGIKPATFVYLRVLKTDQLSLLSWASSSSWNTGVCSGSLESLSFHSRITASVQKVKVSWSIKCYFPAETLPSEFFMHITSIMCLIPSPPEASSSPFGLKRTTLTALVCLARLDRNSTTAFPSPSWSTRHNCRIKPKYTIHPLAMENVTHAMQCNVFPKNQFLSKTLVKESRIHHSMESGSKIIPVHRLSIMNYWFIITHIRCK